MAELGLLASIVQVADVGLRLSLRLYAFGETVASADRSISAISNDVSLTSSVLKELGNLLKSDTSRIYSDNAVKTADAVVQECSRTFQEMDEMLLKKVPHLHTGDTAKQSRASLILERLRWPAIKGKIELLRVNLDRMKSTLTLMLNVIIYAKQLSERKESPSVVSDQRQLIEDLAKANQTREREFHELRLALEGTHLGWERPITKPKSPPPFTTSLLALHPMMSQGAEDPTARKDQIPHRKSPSACEVNPMTSPAVSFLLDEFTKLHSSLLIEVRSTGYKIGNESRMRYESDITSRHTREMQVACTSEQKDRTTTDSHTPQIWGDFQYQLAPNIEFLNQEQEVDDTKDLVELSRNKQTEITLDSATRYGSRDTSIHHSNLWPSDESDTIEVACESEQDQRPRVDLEPVPKMQTTSKKKKKKNLQAGADDHEERDPAKVRQNMSVDPSKASNLPPPSFGPQQASIPISDPLDPHSLGHVPFVIPSDIQVPTQMAGETRKRSATASHRFRQRRKEKEQGAANDITRLEQQVKNMADERDILRRERDSLQNALIPEGTSLSTSNTSVDVLHREHVRRRAPPPRRAHGMERELSESEKRKIAKVESLMENSNNLPVKRKRSGLLRYDLSPSLDELSGEQAEDVTARGERLSNSSRMSASSEAEANDRKHPGTETGSVTHLSTSDNSGRSSRPEWGESGKKIVKTGKKTSMTEEPGLPPMNQDEESGQHHPICYSSRPLAGYKSGHQAVERPSFGGFGGQAASLGDHRAGHTSDALRPSKDTMTVDSLVSKWTNLASSWTEGPLPI